MGTPLSGPLLGRSSENNRIVLGLLELLGRESAQSQRRLAAELGIAVGLVNIYLKRCVKKGLLKMSDAPARRYAYYLTPQGFSEKARLTLEYLSFSFDLFPGESRLQIGIRCSGHARIRPGRIGWRVRACRDRNDLCPRDRNSNRGDRRCRIDTDNVRWAAHCRFL